MAGANSRRVAVVVVAYDRRDLLREALEAIAAQSLAPTAVVVVDNASPDDSSAVATATLPSADVVRLQRNSGGAGGFAAGIARAVAHHAPDYVWLMDDDTVPTPDALEELVAALEPTSRLVVAGSRVVWTDGSDHPMNTPRRKPFVPAWELRDAQRSGHLPIRSTSFVSMLVRADAVRASGLPVADYFIWNDDFEYSTRLLRRARGVYVPQSVVVHKTKALASTDVDPGARFYYEVRNKFWLFTRSACLGARDRVLYGGSSLARWVRTILRSADRVTLLREGLRGARDGLVAPRSTITVLAAEPSVIADVTEIESKAGRV